MSLIFQFHIPENFHSFDLEIPQQDSVFKSTGDLGKTHGRRVKDTRAVKTDSGFRIRLIYSGKQMRRLDLMNLEEFADFGLEVKMKKDRQGV